MKKVLLLSPYDALSHRQWREGLVGQMDDWAVTSVVLPPRYFAWRFRGNSLTLSRHPEIAGDWDAVIATSMTDLSALRGMAPALARATNLVYFHENQFAYPDDSADAHRLERQITSLYTALCADKVLFNTDFNRSTFLEGAAAMLSRMPDHVPAGLVDDVAAKSQVLPVPVTNECFRGEASRPAPATIVWNHRWEYDKGPASLQAIVTALLDADADFVFHLVGQPFRSVPAGIAESLDRLERAGRLGHSGFLARDDYLDLLSRSHIVLSTALHEFQGLGVLEACAAGCTPVVPDRLAYRELIPAAFRYDDDSDAAARLLDLIEQVGRGKPLPRLDVDPLSWSRQRSAWLALVD